MFANLTTAFSLLGDYTEDYAWFPEAASTFSADNDWLYGFITMVCAVFFAGIAGALFYFSVKYRKAKGQKAESNVAHNTQLELAWSILPSFVLIGMFILGAKSYLDHRNVPDGANEVGVQAFKWGWTMDYGGGTFHPELHILLNEPTKLSMRSSDVIHSLYIPAFRAKKDIVPGRYNYMWFKPTVPSEKVSDEELAKAIEEVGDKLWGQAEYDKYQFTQDGYRFYDLYCAEYCGKNHSEMQTVVVVHEKLEELNAWIKKYSTRGAEDPVVYGEKLYARRGCGGCHSVDGSKRVGPSFNETYGGERALANGLKAMGDENYIRESVIYPKAKVVAGYQPVMPSYKGQLSDDDIYSITEYLKSISVNAPKESSTADTPVKPTAE